MTDDTTLDILIGHDPDTWVVLPSAWPHDGHRAPRSWVKATVRSVVDRSDTSTRPARTWLAEVLTALARWSPDDERRYLFLPDITTPPSLLRVQYSHSHGERDEALRAMIFDSDLPAVEPPVPEPVETADLGPGLMAVRYCLVGDDSDSLHATLVHAFRVGPYDIRISCQVGSPDGVPVLLPYVDEFIGGISLVPAT